MSDSMPRLVFGHEQQSALLSLVNPELITPAFQRTNHAGLVHIGRQADGNIHDRFGNQALHVSGTHVLDGGDLLTKGLSHDLGLMLEHPHPTSVAVAECYLAPAKTKQGPPSTIPDGALEVDHRGVAPWFGIPKPIRRHAAIPPRRDAKTSSTSRTTPRCTACSSAAWTKALAKPRCRHAGRTKQRLSMTDRASCVPDG